MLRIIYPGHKCPPCELFLLESHRFCTGDLTGNGKEDIVYAVFAGVELIAVENVGLTWYRGQIVRPLPSGKPMAIRSRLLSLSNHRRIVRGDTLNLFANRQFQQ